MRVIVWSMNILAGGLYPSLDHNGDPFISEDRELQRGLPLANGLRGALCEYRADLLEFQQALGVKRWDNVESPCFFCNCRKIDLHNYPRSRADCTWVEKDAAVYDQMVRSCIKTVRITSKKQMKRLLSCMRHDPEIAGFGLWQACPEVGLTSGWRLVQTGPVVDTYKVMDIECSAAEPAELTFFDSANQIGLNFIAPIFSVFGFTIDMLALDIMHVVDLGISQYLCGAILSILVEGNFAGSNARTILIRRHDNMKFLRRRMKSYYIANQAVLKRGQMSQIFKISLKMLGPRDNPRLHAKAAETRQLVGLLPELRKEHPQFFTGLALFLPHCCTQLKRFQDIVALNPRRLSPDTQRDLEDCAFAFVHFWKRSGGHKVFKHHAFLHLVLRSRVMGNPRRYWTYLDEGENRAMASIAKSLHQGSNFYFAFLEKCIPELC